MKTEYNIYLKQLKFLLTHKWYVLKAGLFVGGIPVWRLLIHDWSKFTPTEFFRYARYKYQNGGKKEWSIGWLHHFHFNGHHPEHWILAWHGNPNFYSDIGEDITKYISVLPMPEVYVREMVADMLATSKEITGNWDIAVWLNENGPNMRLHEDTITRLDSVLIELDYFFTDNCMWSYMAGNKLRDWAQDTYK